jgi:hypothetical protein
MCLKVDESLNVGYAKEAVPLNTIGQRKPFSFCIASKRFTNTAARVTPMKSAPNVFPRSRFGGGRSWVEEDIVSWPISQPELGGMLYIFSATVLLTCSNADGLLAYTWMPH